MKHLVLVMAIGVMTLLVSQPFLLAQVAPSLGTASQFALLGNSAVTGSAGTGTVVNGSVGSFPTGSISNFPPSTVTPGFTLHTTANATVQQAQADARAAYTLLAAQGGTPIAGDNLNTTLGPGVYSLGAGLLPASTTLTLNGAGIFIFNVATTLTTGVSSAILGTANPCNVYWRIGTSATLNGTSFMGTVLADASITLGSGSVTGRLLSGLGATGASTLSVGGNTVGGCSAPQVAPSVTKVFSPASMISGATSRLTISINNLNGASSSTTAVFTDTLPAGVLVAATPGAATTCGGAVSATAGGSTVSLAAGSTLPSGICTIDVNVTSAVVGNHLNTIPAGALQTSAGNNAAPATATLIVTAVPPPVCPAITLGPSPIPNGTVSVVYSQTLTASGGTGPYVFGVTLGTLPAGLTLTPAGLLSGTPTTAASTTFTVRGTDSLGCFAEVVTTFVIAAPPPPGCPVITLTPATMPNGLVGQAYSQTLTASGGAAPYTFTVVGGTLPTGTALTMIGGLGLVSGTPTTNGTFNFTIRATDVNACPVDRAYAVVITTAVPTMPEMFLILLALVLTSVGYLHLRKS